MSERIKYEPIIIRSVRSEDYWKHKDYTAFDNALETLRGQNEYPEYGPRTQKYFEMANKNKDRQKEDPKQTGTFPIVTVSNSNEKEKRKTPLVGHKAVGQPTNDPDINLSTKNGFILHMSDLVEQMKEDQLTFDEYKALVDNANRKAITK